MDLEKQAKAAFIDDHFDLAVDIYSQAIAINPTAELYADCAQANIKLLNFTEAVANANKALELDPTMSKAFLRKGVACMKLEEYETAKAALVAGAALAQEDSRFAKLIKECKDRIEEEAQGMQLDLSIGAPKEEVTPEVATQEATVAKPKYRHEFYQKPEEVVVTIFAKGVPKDTVVVDFGEQILSVTIEKLGEEPYHFQPRLFGKIVPEKCKFEVMSTKIEIRLAKADAVHWTSLEFSKDTTVVAKANTPSVTQRPTYPSSKSKRVDWDKLEAEVKKEEKEEKLDGDAAVNKFFRDIYGNADEDIRRAMTKSFVESNGTVLSTDWKDVGSKKIEGSPPDGMEMRKWEY